jgi:hypothetical protein
MSDSCASFSRRSRGARGDRAPAGAILSCLLTAVIPLLTLPAPASAARFFHGEPRRVRACVLLLPSTATDQNSVYFPDGQNPNPFLFYALDRRTDLRPDSWEFENPIAPPTVTQAMADRWGRISAQPALSVGIPLTKDLAPYWEVPLRTELIDQLVDMDVCYVAASGIERITYQEREMLRRLADSGVLLWIDNAGGWRFPNAADALFFPMAFTPSPGSVVAPVSSHPLLNGLFRLTSQDAQSLGTNSSEGVLITPSASEGSALYDSNKPGLARTAVLTPVIGTGGQGASVAAAMYGSGFLLATARNVGGAISGGLGQGPRPVGNLQAGKLPNLKLAYNAIAWTDAVTHTLARPRRSNGGSNPVASYLERWSFNRLPTGYPSWLQPLVVRNQVFAAFPPGQSPNFSLFSFEANPSDDFDGNGNTVDGLPGNPLGGLATGQNYDLLDGGPLASQGAIFSWVSGLAYGEVNGEGYVFVTGGENGTPDGVSAGTTLVQAFHVPSPEHPRFGVSNLLTWRPPVGSKDVNVRNIWSAPAFFDGLVIAAGGTQGNSLESNNAGVGAVGDMRALRLVPDSPGGPTLVEQWHYPQGNAPETGPIVGPVAVANVQDERSGATDTMVLYTSLTIASSPGGLGCIVIHTAGEPLTALDDGRTWQPTRRVENWDPNQWFDIRVIDNRTGLTAFRYTPATQTTTPVQINVENQPGRIRLPSPVSPNQFTVVAEYSLLNTREGNSGSVVRRYWMPAFNPPGGNFPSSGVSAGPTVDSHGNVYMATGNGYIASLKFIGGQAVISWKARTDTAAGGEYLGQQHTWEPYKEGRLKDHLFVSTPAWKNGVLYVAGRDGVVYAFETQSEFTIKVPFSPGKPPMAPGRPTSVVVYSNEGEQAGDGTPPRTNRVPPDAFTVNGDAGTITIHNMRNVTLDLARVSTQADVVQALGNRLGIPINIDYTDVNGVAQQDITYIPLNLLYRFQTGIGNGAGSAWNQKFIFESSPVVAGDHVYVIGNQQVSGARNQMGPAVLFELPADPRRLDNRFLAGKDVGSWPDASLQPGGADTTRPPGWMVTARPISATPVLASPSIADDLMVIASGEGVTAYKAGRTLIADANRVLEVGTNAQVAASMDATQKLVVSGSDYPIPTDPQLAGLGNATFTSVSKHLDRPSMAKRLNRTSSIASIFFSSAPTEAGLVGEHSEIAEESLLIADTGNDRVVETNPAGKVIWEASSFQDPFRLLPPGEPLTLSEPTDAQRWVDVEAAGGASLLVIHTLIADSGNTRVIELVDKVRFQQGSYGSDSFAQIAGQIGADTQPVRWHHVLVWTSQTNAQGLRLRYRTAQRVYATDENGQPVLSGGVPANTYPRPVMNYPPFLPMEPYESRTMAVVSNARLFYVANPQDPRYGDTNRNKPQVLPGGDTIVFLRSNRSGSSADPIWQPDPTASDPKGFKYVQGTVGQDYPIISEIWDPQGQQVVHQLSGVMSLERTTRVNLADRGLYPGGIGQPQSQIYYLIADGSGVFEFRYVPKSQVDPATSTNPFPRDHGTRLAWAFTNDDYNWVTGGGNGNPNTVRSGDTGRYTGGRTLTASSARLMTNGQVLIASRTAGNPPPTSGPPALGGDVFALRIGDYAQAPNGGPFWLPDLWVQAAAGGQRRLPSITWRVPAPLNPLAAPLPMPGQNGFNPLDLGNTYLPDQPAFADLVF